MDGGRPHAVRGASAHRATPCGLDASSLDADAAGPAVCADQLGSEWTPAAVPSWAEWATRLGIRAATSRIHRSGGRTFLEVERIDRHGPYGSEWPRGR
jgi:hypothetical protein